MIDGVFVNKYIDLDFAYLKDLSIIDHRVRLLFFKMIIDSKEDLSELVEWKNGNIQLYDFLFYKQKVV